MALFRPTAVKPRIGEVTPRLLRRLGARAVLLDVDNTLATYTSHEPIKGALEWTRELIGAVEDNAPQGAVWSSLGRGTKW